MGELSDKDKCPHAKKTMKLYAIYWMKICIFHTLLWLNVFNTCVLDVSNVCMFYTFMVHAKQHNFFDFFIIAHFQ